LETLPEQADPDTGRIHTDYSQTIAATGRLSSNNPNLQNIPIRTELGREIRQGFIAANGCRLISADYSQIELRIVASIAKVKAMIEAFNTGQDIHQRTAADINGVPLDQVTKDQRRAAKEVNFGVLYGMGAIGLSRRTGISFKEAKDFISRYFSTFPEIKDYVERTKQDAHTNGYVETLFGRRRSLKDIHSRNQLLRARAEREAINTPIQGTAADLIKMAMIALAKGLPAVSPKSRLLLQVHDELVVETPAADVKKVSAFLQKTMASVYKLDVPIEVEVADGVNWEEAH
jgi:DNA polymerase-1